MGLGVPFNVASYALLTVILANLSGLRPGELVHVLGDAHVYLSHEAAMRTQLARAPPRAFPTLTLRARPERQALEDFVFEDFVLEGYAPDAALPMPMAL